jgi:glycosyltransferase involved in cell wall biosynthesis
MRRILHLTDSWGPGGAETVFTDLAAKLAPASFESVVGVPRATGWLYEELGRRGIIPLVFPSSGALDLRHVARLVRVIRQRRIDVVQAHCFGTSVYASAAGLLTRIPVVGTLHGRVDIAAGERHRDLKWRLVRRGAARVVCVSQSLRRELVSATPFLDPARIPVIYNGVDVETFFPGASEEKRREIGVRPGRVLIGAVGNVRHVKGYEVLVDAVGTLVRLGLDADVVIIGKGGNEFERDLIQQAEASGVRDRLHFLGFRSDVAELYRALDIYVLTSHSEGFPLSTIQALASGLPVVATRCGGPEEMVDDGVDGFLVERGSGTAVADGLARLIADPALRRRLGSRAREKAVSRFSTAAMVSGYEALYSSLVPKPADAISEPTPSSIGAAT